MKPCSFFRGDGLDHCAMCGWSAVLHFGGPENPLYWRLLILKEAGILVNLADLCRAKETKRSLFDMRPDPGLGTLLWLDRWVSLPLPPAFL